MKAAQLEIIFQRCQKLGALHHLRSFLGSRWKPRGLQTSNLNPMFPFPCVPHDRRRTTQIINKSISLASSQQAELRLRLLQGSLSVLFESSGSAIMPCDLQWCRPFSSCCLFPIRREEQNRVLIGPRICSRSLSTALSLPSPVHMMAERMRYVSHIEIICDFHGKAIRLEVYHPHP